MNPSLTPKRQVPFAGAGNWRDSHGRNIEKPFSVMNSIVSGESSSSRTTASLC
jgi:hypothetical protein